MRKKDGSGGKGRRKGRHRKKRKNENNGGRKDGYEREESNKIKDAGENGKETGKKGEIGRKDQTKGAIQCNRESKQTYL